MTLYGVGTGRVTRCGSCGDLVPRGKLARQYREWGEPPGSNYLLHSSYNSTFWTCDATDAGRISIGPYEGSRVRVSPGESTTTTEVNGSQTWTGTGTFRSTVAVDGSTWTSLCFACRVGPYHNPTASAQFTAVIGLCNSAGTVITTEKTYTAELGMREIWFSKLISAIAAPTTLYFYVTVTPATGESWWVDMLRLEKNKLRPDNFFETKGAARDESASVMRSAVVLVCPNCRMPIFHRWDKEAREPLPTIEPADDIEVL